MEGCRPLLALPLDTAWADRGADIPPQREIDEDDFVDVWTQLTNAYGTGQTAVCDVYALIDFFHQLTFSTPGRTLRIVEPAVADVLRALKAHGDAAGDANTPRNAWRVWGGPPDDERWWTHLWKKRSEWEKKRDQYVKEQNRDYGRGYKHFHISHMHKLFGAYDFKKDESIDALKVGARTYKLVDDLVTQYAAQIAARDAALPINPITIGKPSIAIMDPESYRMYAARSSPLNEMKVLGEHIWKHYDVPRNRYGDMFVLGVNAPFLP